MAKVTLTTIERDTLVELLAESFHTGFRKASDHDNAHQIWKLIQGLPSAEWGNVVDFVVFCITPYLEQDLLPAAVTRGRSSRLRKISRPRSK